MSTPQFLKLENQEVIINLDSKVLILELKNKFNYAGFLLHWPADYSTEAFGINKTICQNVIDKQLKLLIRFSQDKAKTEYWTSYDKLKQFIKNYQTLYRVSATKTIRNIPCSLFSQKPNFKGDGN